MIDIPDHVFENRNIEKQLFSESEYSTPIIKASFNNGLFLYFEGAEYPQKVITTTEIMHAINIAKAVFMDMFAYRPALKGIESTLSSFNRIGMKILSPYILKPEYMTAQCRELRDILYNFIFSLTSNDIIACHFSQIVSHLIEYDNAYRLRFIDIANETTKENLLSNPRKEILRLFDILSIREVQHKGMVTNKIKKFVSFALLLLLIPKVGNALKMALNKANFNNLAYDNVDTYWAFQRIDYDFKGLDKRVRSNLIDNAGYSRPVLNKIIT